MMYFQVIGSAMMEVLDAWEGSPLASIQHYFVMVSGIVQITVMKWPVVSEIRIIVT